MTLSNDKDTKIIDGFLDGHQMETHYEYDDEKPPCHSEYGKTKYLHQTLK